MLTIGLFAVITAVSGFFGFRYKNNNDCLKVVSILFGLAFCICTLTLININSRFETTKENYYNLKLQVDSYNSMPDSCKNISFEYDIRKDVLQANDIISKHKVMSRSPWVNIWYSKNIGKLEKLQIYYENKKETNY